MFVAFIMTTPHWTIYISDEPWRWSIQKTLKVFSGHAISYNWCINKKYNFETNQELIWMKTTKNLKTHFIEADCRKDNYPAELHKELKLHRFHILWWCHHIYLSPTHLFCFIIGIIKCYHISYGCKLYLFKSVKIQLHTIHKYIL